MIKKIILGTANFGSNYGVINKNFIDFSLAKEILSVASKNGIYHLDTAPDYKNSEIILGNIGVKNFNIATKLLPPTENNYDFKKFFYAKIYFRFEIKKFQIGKEN